MSNIMDNKMDKYVIGIVGGMGSYATVEFFKRIIDSYPAEKEWERPRIIIDNNCTMPSRVRAILYKENEELLIEQLSESVKGLINAGATKIILACNTSHCFLDEVQKHVPEAADKVINIITACAEEIKTAGEKDIFLMATEGTILSGIYETIFSNYEINCQVPTEDDFLVLRRMIEGVKQKKIDDELIREFIEYINCSQQPNVVLGCTELPILYEACGEQKNKIKKKIYDPLDSAINKIKEGN